MPQDIISRVLSLRERIALKTRISQTSCLPHSEDRLGRWIELATKGNSSRFEQLLTARGIDLAGANELLSSGQGTFQSDSLNWHGHVEKICSIYSTDITPKSALAESTRGILKPERPLPFEGALLPVIDWVSGQLLPQVECVGSIISPSVYGEFLHYLLCELSIQCERVLYDNFIVFRQLRQSGFARVLSMGEQGKAARFYQEYMAHLLNGGMLHVFHNYPVLARNMAAIAFQWIETTRDLLHCLTLDINRISNVFYAGRDPGAV